MIDDKKIIDSISLTYQVGYYKVGDLYTFNKLEALRHFTQNQNLNLSYHYLDEIFGSLDWTKESHYSLEELYAQRAQQIRDQYDYLILSFSGGSDSSNILDTFLKNNIKLDEVVTYYPIKAIEKFYKNIDLSDRSNTNLALEYIGAAVPKLNELSKLHPNIKITILDNSEPSIKLVESDSIDKLDMGQGAVISPHCSGHFILGEYIRSVTEKSNGKKIAHIVGVDKPRLGYERSTKTLGVYFDDMSNTHGNFLDSALNGFRPNTENFYYSINFPDLWKKQCQVLVRELAPIITQEPVSDFYKELHFSIKKQNKTYEIIDVHHDYVKKILYPDWNLKLFQAKKPTSAFYHQMSHWFFNGDLVSQRTKDLYEGKILESVYGIDDRFITRNKNGRLERISVMRTRALNTWNFN